MADNFLLVGGAKFRPSNILNLLFNCIGDTENGIVMCSNGDKIPDSFEGYDIIYWWLSQSAKIPKRPIKSTLICSKDLTCVTNRQDLLYDLRKIGAHAIVFIDRTSTPYVFELVDCLGTTWVRTTNIPVLANCVRRLHNWISTAIRSKLDPQKSRPTINQIVRDDFVREYNRFNLNFEKYTNLSLSCRTSKDLFMFCPRDKNDILESSAVVATSAGYFGAYKPVLGAPIHLKLYKRYPKINCILHGHYTLKECKQTKDYFPCGDLRILPQVYDLLDVKNNIINIKNHGFLICAQSIHQAHEYLNLKLNKEL